MTITHTDLKRGIKMILEGEPYEILEASPLKMAQRRVVIQTKIKNLITGSVFEKNFHQGDVFEEAELQKFDAKFLYSHKRRYFFCEALNPAKRFDLSEEQMGNTAKYLKTNQIVEGIVFDEKVINISLPIKIQLAVKEAPPGVRGDRAQGGTKSVILESGAKVNVPLFIETGDIIEINTETGEYVRRISTT